MRDCLSLKRDQWQWDSIAKLLATAQVHQGDALVIDRHRGEGGLVSLETQKSDLQVQKLIFPSKLRDSQ
jgi:hypothetical protein